MHVRPKVISRPPSVYATLPVTVNGAQTVTTVNIVTDSEEGKAGLATPAHGRAVSGAGGAGFGITVRASAFVRCTDKYALSFRHSCVHFISPSPILTSVQLGLVCNVGVIPNTNQCKSALNPFRKHRPDQ